MKYYFRIFIHCIAPIMLGIAIYALWRGINIIDSRHIIFPLIHSFQPPNWIKYNLPDGLWFYALLSTLFFVWKEKISGHFIAWIVLVISISYLSEVLQAYYIIHGTFDWKDLLAYTIAIFFFFFNFQYLNKRVLLNHQITNK